MTPVEGRHAATLPRDLLLPLLGLVLSLVINFRSYLVDFNLVPGDLGDTRLMVFTLEHWFRVFQGQEFFYTLRMFHPDPLALAYADGLLLFGIPYSALRALGLDYFTSYQLLLVCLTLVGYFAWLGILKRGFQLRVGAAALGAVLLTSLNALQVQADIGKLTAVHLFPVLLWLLWIALRQEQGWRAMLATAGFAGGLGLLFFTSYYPAWFLLFALVLFAVIALIAAVLLQGSRVALAGLGSSLAVRWPQWAVGTAVFLVSLAPFFVTYAPLVASNASRQFNLVLEFTPRLQDVVNVSPLNYIWSPILRALAFDFRNREVQMGSPILVAFLAFLTTVVLARRLHRQAWGGLPTRDRLLMLLVATAAVIVITSIKVSDTSLWYLVYRAIPGASALRAVGRILLVVDMILIVVAVWGLNEAWMFMCRRWRRGVWLLRVASALVAILLLAEQTNAMTFRLDKAAQLEYLNSFDISNNRCEAFFINNAAEGGLPIGYYQLDAMMIGMQLGLPTVNGYSGIAPDEAFALAPLGVEYTYRILEWLQSRGATDGICELDLQTSRFRPVAVAAEYEEAGALFRAELQATFAKLYGAAADFLADGHSLEDLHPRYLQDHGYLDPSLGYETGPRYRWIGDRYWIGPRPCGNRECIGIGVKGEFGDLMPIIEAFGPLADRVYFPDPQILSSSPSSTMRGEALLVFRPETIHR